MTQMQAHERFENSALVEAWLKEPTFLEPVDEGRVAAIVHHTPQARRWPPQVDLGRFAPMLNATKFVTASVILALTGGLLLNALPTEPTTTGPVPATETATETAVPTSTEDTKTEPTTERAATTDSDMPVIRLPDELPDGAESGTIDTPAGPIEWVHLTGKSGSLPADWSQLFPWNDGILAWQGYFSHLQTTDDGANWTKVDTDGLHGEMVMVGDEWLLVNVDRDRVLKTSDPTGEWTELDNSALAEARLPGWDVADPRIVGRPMLVGDRVIFVAEYIYSLPKKQLGISKSGTKNLRELPDGRYVLCSSGDRADCSGDARWVLRFKETPQGLVVRHDKSGKRLGLIEGATADQIYTAEQGKYRRLFAIEGDEVVEIDSPWPGISPWQVANRVVAPGGNVPVLRQWQSGGKADSSVPGLPTFAAEIPKNRFLFVTAFPDRLAAWTSNQRGHTVNGWVSSDGVDWTPAPDGAPDGAGVQWTGAAWLASRAGADHEHWVYVGDEWVSLESIGYEDHSGGWPRQPVGIGNTLLLSAHNDKGPELWVVTLPVDA